jgi:hypothetical protein
MVMSEAEDKVEDFLIPYGIGSDTTIDVGEGDIKLSELLIEFAESYHQERMKEALEEVEKSLMSHEEIMEHEINGTKISPLGIRALLFQRNATQEAINKLKE